MTKHPKRPRDLNQWAKHMVDLATGAATDESPAGEPKSPTGPLPTAGNLLEGPRRTAIAQQRRDLSNRQHRVRIAQHECLARQQPRPFRERSRFGLPTVSDVIHGVFFLLDNPGMNGRDLEIDSGLQLV